MKRLILISFFLSFVVNGFTQEIKKPAVAGTFYPQDAEELSLMIERFLDEVKPPTIDEEIFGLIQPHAGYPYSGKVASFGYKVIKGKSYKTVVIIGPSHYFGFRGVSIYPEGVFRSPLKDTEIDRDFTSKLLYREDFIYFEPLAFQREHSIEVQLPFLQKILDNFKIVPILMGECTLSMCERLASLLKEAIAGRKDVLVIASSDMYHGYDYKECELIDKLTLSYLESMDIEGLSKGLEEGKLQLCGKYPVLTLLILAKSLGHNKLKVLNYTNSSNVTYRKIPGIWTVGYSSCVIDKEETMLNKEQRKKLLEIARKTIEFYLKTGKKLELEETDPLLLEKRGAFVTLHKFGQLRGCIGNLIGEKPLYLTVQDMAIESAMNDPRFPPLKLEELNDVEIEISVLSPLERVNNAEQIQLGKHGVLVRRGFRSGVFLPQVAQETGWSKEEFLSYLCSHKAGLHPLAWKEKDTELYIFTAEVFSEKDF
ncbi:MAG: AmmeMemoRadiSam system protein B [Candidatus Omnitrophica bacterium]|nr:AmmeMemoRadiSam system protein B [Candidatus Omnitrophota bacterium]